LLGFPTIEGVVEDWTGKRRIICVFFLKKKIKVYNVVFPEKEKESSGAGFCFIGLDTWAFYS